MRLRFLPVPFALAIVMLAASCTHAPTASRPAPAWDGARQLVLVTTPDWNATEGTLRSFERGAGGEWRETGSATPITVGRSGTAWGIGLHPAQPGLQKKEGDGRAPAGVFAIGPAFGYAPSASTALPYLPMQTSHWCMDVVDSPLYNRIVDARDVGEDAVQGSSEPMRLDLHNKGDQRYREGFVIEHNLDGKVASGGSCIFAHLWGQPGQATAGCTAMAPATMQALLGWLDRDAKPVFVLLPRAHYRSLQQAWGLPAIAAAEAAR